MISELPFPFELDLPDPKPPKDNSLQTVAELLEYIDRLHFVSKTTRQSNVKLRKNLRTHQKLLSRHTSQMATFVRDTLRRQDIRRENSREDFKSLEGALPRLEPFTDSQLNYNLRRYSL